jgi:hypothetical protein
MNTPKTHKDSAKNISKCPFHTFINNPEDQRPHDITTVEKERIFDQLLEQQRKNFLKLKFQYSVELFSKINTCIQQQIKNYPSEKIDEHIEKFQQDMYFIEIEDYETKISNTKNFYKNLNAFRSKIIPSLINKEFPQEDTKHLIQAIHNRKNIILKEFNISEDFFTFIINSLNNNPQHYFDFTASEDPLANSLAKDILKGISIGKITDNKGDDFFNHPKELREALENVFSKKETDQILKLDNIADFVLFLNIMNDNIRAPEKDQHYTKKTRDRFDMKKSNTSIIAFDKTKKKSTFSHLVLPLDTINKSTCKKIALTFFIAKKMSEEILMPYETDIKHSKEEFYNFFENTYARGIEDKPLITIMHEGILSCFQNISIHSRQKSGLANDQDIIRDLQNNTNTYAARKIPALYIGPFGQATKTTPDPVTDESGFTQAHKKNLFEYEETMAKISQEKMINKNYTGYGCPASYNVDEQNKIIKNDTNLVSNTNKLLLKIFQYIVNKP